MNRLRLILVLAVLVAPPLTPAGPAAAQTLTRGPLIQNPDALTTTMTILWWTDVAGDSTVEYGLTPALGSSKNVAQAGSCEIGSAGTCHAVPLTGLAAGTRYHYRLLTNGVQVLGTSSFETFLAPTDTSELFFSVVGDFGQGSSGQADVANNQNASDPPLLITVGDNAYQNGTQSDWDNNVFIPEYKDQILRRAVFIPVLGNHDLNNVGASNWASSVEIRMHQLPRNAPAGQQERFFSFDSGDAHFVVLDSNPGAVGSTQTTWLANDLASTTRKWVFVFLHHTPYSCANGIASIGSDLTVRSTWGPLFEQYGVDIVFVGHDHSYERSRVVDDYVIGGGTGSDGLGTIYVMTGGGGASLDGAANVDAGGPYRQVLFGSKTYCPWLSDECPNGAGGEYCSFSRYQHTEVRIQNNDTLTVQAVDRNDVVFDEFTIVKTQVCGDGTVQLGEECDQGAANGTSGSCCTSACSLASSGSVCRTSAGVCDVAESCDGASAVCPADLRSTAECRVASGVCDVAESCNGVSNDCPADGVASSATVCRGAADACDVAESCDGTSKSCPVDFFASNAVVCRFAAGLCDVAETCTGLSPACPADALAGSGTLCRGAADLCDQPESCTGSSPACPANVLQPLGALCRAATGACDVAESCTGASAACPADALASSGALCRAAAGGCDVAESCTGASAQCPADAFAGSGTVCRESAGVCDLSESCTGASAFCPADLFQPNTTVCRVPAGVCDVAERCTGSTASCPSDALASPSTVCRASAAPCDAAETCTGTSLECPADAISPLGAVCRPQAGTCDVAESCDGVTTTCPADAFVAGSVTCRPSLGVCDVAEQCTGAQAQCPANGFAPASTVCRGALDLCDVAETCTGASATCPSNAFQPVGTVCRAATGDCDIAETCSGSGVACPADQIQPAEAICRPAVGDCDLAEACDGISVACPADSGLPDVDGDGTCDAEDGCPAVADPAQADADADGLGDACDPCSNFLPVFATRPKLKLSKLATAPGDDKLKFSGSILIPTPPFIDPVANGVRVLLHDVHGTAVLDAAIPGGAYDPLTRAGWRVNASGTAYTYRNAGAPEPLVQGISTVSVKLSPRTPGAIRFSVSGKDGAYPVAAGDLPLVGTLVLDPPHATTNQCGEALFGGPVSSCSYAASSGVVKCR